MIISLTRKLVLLSLLACLLAVYFPISCSAATLTAQEQEIRSLLNNSIKSSQISEILQLNSTDSQKMLLQVSEELKQSQIELATLKQELAKLQKNLEAATASSKNSEDLIAKTNVLFETYSKEMNSKVNSLRRDRTILEIVAGVAIGYGMYASVK